MSSNTIISFRPETVIRHIPWRLDSKAALGFLLILATFSLVGWLYLTQASAVTATSYRIDELRLELDQLKNQNAALVVEIAELQALARVEARARNLGFVPATNLEYMPVANYPVPSVSIDGVRGTAHAANTVDTYTTELQGPGWWVEKLDTLAAWVEK